MGYFIVIFAGNPIESKKRDNVYLCMQRGQGGKTKKRKGEGNIERSKPGTQIHRSTTIIVCVCPPT